ncbi:hypothetical protein DFH07DRAFT_827054, partial [Mycena maculata]
MEIKLNSDVFSTILAQIPDSKTVHAILIALQRSHSFFPIALTRLSQLPIYLDSYDPRAASASQKVLDYLLDEGFPLVGSIRHLVVSVERGKDPPVPNSRGRGRGRGRGGPPSLQSRPNPNNAMLALQCRLPALLRRAVNLRSFDYHSFPGSAFQSEHFDALQRLERLRSFSVDCALWMECGIGSALGPPTNHATWAAEYDADNWEMEPFLSTIGPTIASLELRHVNYTMFTALAGHTAAFASYRALEHLKIDITEGVWDWNGGGSPAWGASPAVTFPCLGFPSVRRFELVVCDQTLQNAQTGPLDLVHRALLAELSIDVRYAIDYTDLYDTLRLFEALSPVDFPALARLEIKDQARNTRRHYWDAADNAHLRWDYCGRAYPGLVPSFLGAIRTGHLPHLTTLWADEKVLLLPYASVEDLFTENAVWADALRAAFAQLESLRVGFGAITHIAAGLILDLCDPNKLTQFGFEWNWHSYGREEPISPALLAYLSRFPKLTDVHVLFPRPGTYLQFNGLPAPAFSVATLVDVAALFRCNGAVSCVGIGNSVVWERGFSPQAPLLVSDGSTAPSAAVSLFFHAGFLPRDIESSDVSNNAEPPRRERREEIEQLRGMLERVL